MQLNFVSCTKIFKTLFKAANAVALSHCLQHQHNIVALGPVSVTPLLVLLPANAPGKIA